MSGTADTLLDRRLLAELGMPFVPTVFTLLARHGRYLTAELDAFFAAPLPDVDQHARRTRAIGQAAATALVDEPLGDRADAPAILALLDRYNEANPRSLLVTTPLARGRSLPSDVMTPPLPVAHSGDALADIRACHGAFNLPGLWREFAERWPDQLGDAWSVVRGLAAAEDFHSARDEVLSLALDTVAGRTAPTPADVGCDEGETAEINQILGWYQVVIATMTVEIECLRRAFASRRTGQEG